MTHTPGPWYWDINRRTRTIRLWGGNRLVVMDFARWGMQSAQPRFSNRPDDKHGGIMYTAEEYDQEEVEGFVSVGSHPDARLIAAAPDLLDACESALFRLKEYEYQAMQRTIEKLTAAIAKAKGGDK